MAWQFLGDAIMGAAGLLGAGVDFLSTKSANKYNLQAQRETNEMNYKIAQENNSEQMRRQIAAQQFDVEQWNRNNAYNSFAAQMQRARDAGLNPQGIVSNTPSTQVTAPTPPTPITPTMQAPHKDPESWNLRETIQNWYANVRSLFDMRKDMRQDVRDQEQHDQNMQEGAERLIGLKKQNAKTEEERRKAAAEATDLEYAIERNKERHSKDIEMVDKQIQKIDSDIQDANNAAERDNRRITIEERAQSLAEKLGESNIKVNNAQMAQIRNAIKLANELNERQSQIHEKEMRSRQLDNDLKALHNMVERTNLPPKMIYENILLQNEQFHDTLKNDSEINMIMERAFGLGFRDLGNALKSLLSIAK